MTQTSPHTDVNNMAEVVFQLLILKHSEKVEKRFLDIVLLVTIIYRRIVLEQLCVCTVYCRNICT